MDYSIIIATYNSQNHIRFLVEEIVKMFKDKKASFEIVLVNDASLDNTQQVLENLSLSHQEITKRTKPKMNTNDENDNQIMPAIIKAILFSKEIIPSM